MRILALLLAACTVAGCSPPPKTPGSMLAYRLANPECKRTCPIGEYIEPIEPQSEHVLEDCCVDPFGVGWSACAWNSSGRYATREQLMDPARLGGNCGGPGYPDCEAR